MITSLALALLVGIIVWRVILPSMKLESEETVTMNTGTLPATTSPTPPKKGLREQAKKHLWSILLVLAGAAVFFWGLYTPELRLSQVGSWSWNHWLSLSAFLGIIFVLIALNAKALGATAKPLGSMLTGVAFMLFIGFPVWFGVRDAVLPSRLCPNGSANEIRECKVNTAWPYWIEGDTGTTPGFLLCFDGPVEPDSAIMNGRSVYRFRAYEGESLVSYKFKEKCGGPL